MKFSHDVIYRFPSLVVYFNPDTAITTDDFIQGERHRFSNRHRNTLQLWRNQILHFSMLLAQVASFHIFCNIASILCLKGLSAHFWYVESLPRWDAVALDLQLSPIPSWMPWIICCVPSLDLIASLLPLYIKFPPRIAIFLEPFSSFSFFYRLRGKKFLYEEIVSTSALMCNIRNQD